MTNSLHSPPHHSQPVIEWYKKAQVDYTEHYIRLFIAYNAWYREATGTANNRQALGQLKKRTVIWDDYIHGKTMQRLSVYMQQLAELSQREPLGVSDNWNGCLETKNDWRSLIEYWYYVRCRLVHGSEVKPLHVWLAYETLDVFMGEIVDRMQVVLMQYIADYEQVSPEEGPSVSKVGCELANSRGSKITTRSVGQKIFQQYHNTPNVWQVDLQRT